MRVKGEGLGVMVLVMADEGVGCLCTAVVGVVYIFGIRYFWSKLPGKFWR